MSESIRLLCIILVIIIPTFIPAQEWVTRYNGPGNDDDRAVGIVVDNAGYIYITGTSHGAGTGEDYATIKYDSLGAEQWVARYDSLSGLDAATAIAIDDAGNVYVTGQSGIYGIVTDYATIKYDSLGVQQWVVRYNGPGNSYDRPDAIAIDTMGNVYVTGQSTVTSLNDDYATVKYNSLGVEQWAAIYDGPDHSADWAYALAVDDLGNVYVTGWSGLPQRDCATVKYDSLGVEQWVARYNGPDNGPDGADALAIDSSGNVYITGYSIGATTGADYIAVKYNTLGGEQWARRYNGPGNGWDHAGGIVVDNVGNVYVTGSSEGSGTGYDYATVKYDTLGVEQWVARYNGPGNGSDHASAIALDNACNIYVTGSSYFSYAHDYDWATIKYDSTGATQQVTWYNGPGNGDDGASAITVDVTGNVYVTGSSVGSGTGYDYATIRNFPPGVEERTANVVKKGYLATSIYSGPLRLPEGKQCEVFDITGRVVEPNKIQPGIYFIEVDGMVTQKVVRVR